jgi:hypothetical protein
MEEHPMTSTRGSKPFGRRAHWGLFGTLAILSAAACSAGPHPEELFDRTALASTKGHVIDARRSLVVTETPILARFSLERVLDQIVRTSGVSGQSATALFQQWWDTQNPGPGLGQGPHCDDAVDDRGRTTLNGYPYTCRAAPAEGAQAACNPFSPGSPCAYLPIGLFMRFDLAPEDGTNCGEYRVVYAKESGTTADQDRNLVIFEAALRNPHVNQGLRGCRKIVEAWSSLSMEPDMARRATLLEEIYFTGHKEFDPVISWQNFGDNPDRIGQVRTNQFVQPLEPRVWSLREFKIERQCSPTCRLRFLPVTVKVDPFGPLFDGASTDPRAASFQDAFLANVERLAAPSLSGLGMAISDTFNAGQSQAGGGSTESSFLPHFGSAPSAFRSAIEGELTAAGSGLTADDIVKRAQAMSCAGCHRFSNRVPLGGGLVWPASLGFTHVSERDADLEVVEGVSRYRISEALVDVFLPHRKQVLEDYLNNVPRPAKAPKRPIGGRSTH